MIFVSVLKNISLSEILVTDSDFRSRIN